MFKNSSMAIRVYLHGVTRYKVYMSRNIHCEEKMT